MTEKRDRIALEILKSLKWEDFAPTSNFVEPSYTAKLMSERAYCMADALLEQGAIEPDQTA